MTGPFEPDDSRYDQQAHLYELIGFENGFGIDAPLPLDADAAVHEMFRNVMYNDEITYSDRIEEYERLIDYLMDAYGYDFDDLWDWEEFREWYNVG